MLGYSSCLVVWIPLFLDPSDGVFGRFDLAALCGCRTLNFCLFVRVQIRSSVQLIVLSDARKKQEHTALKYSLGTQVTHNPKGKGFISSSFSISLGPGSSLPAHVCDLLLSKVS